MHPTFSPLSDETGLDIVDPIETRHFSVLTDSAVNPTDADPDEFAFPVSTACRIRAGRLRFPYMVPTEVRTPDGDHRASIDLPTTRKFPDDEYLLEFHSPLKVYLRTTGEITIDASDDSVEIEFDEETAVTVGARSYHSSPAATITVPDDPEAMMQAVSAFSSALKTTSPERAWPTLRGHPPRIERGEELSIPDALETPDTGIEISVPAEYGHVYTVAPLAYYLGAAVVPGESARLTTDSGIDRFLGDDVTAVGESVEKILKRVFLLDCVTRTEGLYPDELHERAALESVAEFDFKALYEASPADRLAAYLAVPDETYETIETPWHRVTHVETAPGPDAARFLPYVVNDLSLVQVKPEPEEEWSPTETQKKTSDALDAFVRTASRVRSTKRNHCEGVADADNERDDESDCDGESEADAAAARGVPDVGDYISLPETNALEQAWIGDRTPLEGTKLLEPAFEHESTASEDGTVEITVVCNDEQMREEWDSAAEIYADREELRASVTCEFDVSTARLRDLLAEDTDMFHFVGHIDGLGFQCSDGILDANTLDETGATTVLLNGCRSHDQGVSLIEAGASAAVVSLGDLWNEGAVEVGETLARLFHHGFSIGHAMTIVREHTSLGREYVVLGDPGVTLAQCETGVPTIFHITEESDEEISGNEITVETCSYPSRIYDIGSTLRTYIDHTDPQHVAVGRGTGERVTINEFQETFEDGSEPVIVDSELLWTEDYLNL